MKFFKSFYSYVPAELPKEMPKHEPLDPNEHRTLPNSVRSSRRNVFIVAGVSIAWSTAQFAISSPTIKVSGIELNVANQSIPIILAALLIYFSYRWMMEFAMMTRHLRRWPIAQLDFRITLFIFRISLLFVSAGALETSLRTVFWIVISLGFLILASSILIIPFMFVTMPIRMWARSRAGRESVANSSIEALIWAGFFSICVAIICIIPLGIACYKHPTLSNFIWDTPPNPVAFGIFLFTLILVFLSYWLLRPLISKLFAEPADYWTEKDQDGIIVHPKHNDKEPLL